MTKIVFNCAKPQYNYQMNCFFLPTQLRQLAKFPDNHYIASKSTRHGRHPKNRKKDPQVAPGIGHPFRALLRRDAYLLHRGARALAIMGADRSVDAPFGRPCRPALPLHQARVHERGRLTHREESINYFHPTPGIDLSGRRWRRRNYSFQHRMSRREGAVPERDDGVCLTTVTGPVCRSRKREESAVKRLPAYASR